MPPAKMRGDGRKPKNAKKTFARLLHPSLHQPGLPTGFNKLPSIKSIILFYKYFNETAF